MFSLAGDDSLPSAETPGQPAEGARGHAPPVFDRDEHRRSQASLPQSHSVLAAAQSNSL